MTLAAWQYAYRGLTIGDGTPYEVQQIDGLDDLAPVRTNDQPRARFTGYWPGSDFAGMRSITLIVEVQGPAESPTFLANINAFRQAFGITEVPESPFQFNLPSYSQVMRCNVRTRKAATPIDLNYRFGKALYAVQLDATDPRRYDDVASTVTVPVATPSVGFSFPLSFPMTFGTAGAGGSFVAVNDGIVHTEPVCTIYGPVQNPSISNQTTGETLAFNITLGATDVLVVDLGLHSVVLNGQSSQRGTLAPGFSWWSLAPGSSTIVYRANTVYTGSTMTMVWRGAM